MVDWATLPKDLLNLISKSLDSSFDLLQFRSVCSSWRSSAEAKPPLPTHHLPILPDNGTSLFPDSAVGFRLSQRSILLVKPHKPPINGSDLFGWLVKVEEDLNAPRGKVTLLDPMSETIHSLPEHFPRSLDMSEFKIRELGREFKLHYFNTVGDIINSLYLEKAVVRYLDSCSKFVLLTIHVSGKLAVFTSWDRAWTVINDMPSPYDDVIVFDGRFFGVDNNGRTVVVDFADLKLELVATPVYGGDKKFLIESCGEMLMVDMYLSMEEVDGDPGFGEEVFEHHAVFMNERTVKFKVFKFVEGEKSWVEVKDLGGKMLFLGDDCNFTASASDLLPSCGGSCVFFNGNVFNEDNVDAMQDRDLGPTPIPAKSSSSASASASASSTASPAAASAGSHLQQPMSTKTTLGEKKSKRATLTQIHNDTISVAKAALIPVKANIMPQRQRQKKKPVSYTQLARSIHELAATLDQKSSQKQLVNHVFPKLAVYNSVDPSLAPSLLMLNQQCEDRNVLRYVYYYLARILSDTGMSPGGGIPTPNWDALADIDAGGGVTRADVVPRIVNQLTSEASNSETEFHARRLQALKALTYSPSGNSELLSKLYEIVFGLLDKVADVPNKRKKGVFGTKGGDKESIIRSNLQYTAMSALRRLPLDPGNPLFLHRAAQGVSFADPVAVRHSLEILSELAARDPYSVAMTLEKLASPAGALQDILHLNDVLARVALARLCHSISRARALDERPDIRSHFNSILYQLLLDPSERVCYEAILCILGKYDNTERTDERASGWYRLTREILKLPEAPSKDKSNKTKRPQPLIKLVMRRLESSFRSFSRPVLHAAARVVQEMGKSRAAAFAMGLQDIDESVHVNSFSDVLDDAETNDSSHPEGIRRTSSISAGPGRNETIASLLASLMEVVRTTVACECVYVRGMVVKALIWMQSPHESLDELKSIIASELSDPAWPAALVNDVLLTLHARFKATPDMAVILLEIARIFATKVPGKIDADVLQLLWKTCLIGAGPDGKHTALEAVTIVLDLPPPQPGSMSGLTSLDRVSASDPKSALALQKLVQAAVWFLGENANYAASEYAWESATPPGTALMMLDADKMVAAASSRNPTLAGALTRLQRCAFSGSWEVRIVAVQALTTIAIRSGEPFRLQIYEFLYTLAEGGVQSQLSEMHLSNGEDQGVSGTGLGVLITPMLKVLDEMYVGQDELIKDMRNHDNANKEWKDEELKKLYETHERLLDFVSLFCYIPRAKYLPLGPISAKLIDTYRTKHNITASSGSTDPTVLATGISDLIYESTQPAPAASNSSGLDDDLVNAWAANLGDDGLLGNNAPAMSRVNEFIAGVGTDAPDVDEENVFSRPSVGYDDMWAKTLLENNELEEDDARSGSSSPDSTGSVESSISSHFGGMNYPSLFSSKPSSQATAKSSGSKYQSTYEGYGSPIREEPPPPYSYSEPQSRESFENPMAESSSRSYGSDDDEPRKSTGTRFGTALYDFTAGGDDELNLTAEEELEIEYEVDGWFYVKKKRPGRDGKMAGLVPVLYVNQS